MKDYASQFVKNENIYLLNHSVGRPPVNSKEAIIDGFFDCWEKAPAEPWESWLKGIDNFCDALAVLFNTQAAQLCPQANLSSALTKVIYSLPPSDQRKTILLSEEDFPSLGFVVQQAQSMGYTCKFIPAEMDLYDMQVWESYINEEVLFVLLTHVQSTNGRLLPIQDILEITRSKGCFSILDVAQSAGLAPINLQNLEVDFVIGSCVKWLCGGPGAGFLWVNENMLEQCKPIDVGWFSHSDPFEFNIHDFRFSNDAKKFWGGTPSVSAFIIAANSIQQITDIGVEVLRKHNLDLTQLVINSWAENVVSPHEAESRSGTLIVNFGANQQNFIEKLKKEKVQFDRRNKGVRLSPHIYNTHDEITKVLSCIPD